MQTDSATLVKRIYNLKIWQVLLLLFLLSLSLLFIEVYTEQIILTASQTGTTPSETWVFIGSLPLSSLRDAFFTTLLVGITFEWLVRRESDAQLTQLIEQGLDSQRLTMIEEIPRALMLSKDVMEETLKQEKVEEIIRSSLQVKLGDTQMGNDIYDGLLRKTFSFSERWANYRFKATLSTIRDESFPESTRNKYFNITVDLRYETKLSRTSFRFQCVDTVEEYNGAIRHPENQFTWLFPKNDEFSVIDQRVFDVLEMRINDIELEISRSINDLDNLVIDCFHQDLKGLLDTVVTIYYRYVVKIERIGHLFMGNVTVPTKNVVYELDYADTDIMYVNVLDFFVSSSTPKITYLPSNQLTHKIEVELNEWAFPKGGVVFVWVLQKERPISFQKPAPKRSRLL